MIGSKALGELQGNCPTFRTSGWKTADGSVLPAAKHEAGTNQAAESWREALGWVPHWTGHLSK